MRVDNDGVLTIVAGTAQAGYGGDGGPATAALLNSVNVLAVDARGNLFIADGANNRVRRVDEFGTITTVAGTGVAGFSGDGGPATQARLAVPSGLAFDAAGNTYVSDSGNNRIRRIALEGTMQTVVGSGAGGVSGDGGPALYIADVGNGKVRRVEGVGPAASGAVNSSGYDNVGQLGRDPIGPSVPLAVSDISSAVAVRAGFAHSLALADDGTVSAWGYGAFGQLGTGSTPDRSPPVPVAGLTGATAISAGGLHSLAAIKDGSVVTWGWNAYGQLGDGSKTDRARPVKLPQLTDVVSVAGGMTHSLALGRDGTVWAWGLNHVGQLGIGSASESLVPVRVPGLTGVVAISAGAYHSVALKDDGTVWTWGWNGFGQLGDVTTTDRPKPVRVVGLSG